MVHQGKPIANKGRKAPRMRDFIELVTPNGKQVALRKSAIFEILEVEPAVRMPANSRTMITTVHGSTLFVTHTYEQLRELMKD